MSSIEQLDNAKEMVHIDFGAVRVVVADEGATEYRPHHGDRAQCALF